MQFSNPILKTETIHNKKSLSNAILVCMLIHDIQAKISFATDPSHQPKVDPEVVSDTIKLETNILRELYDSTNPNISLEFHDYAQTLLIEDRISPNNFYVIPNSVTPQ